MSEHQVEAVMSTILGCGKRLQRWVEALENSHPLYQNDTPDPSSMNIGNLVSGGDLMSDTCNGERKTRRLIVEKMFEASEAYNEMFYYAVWWNTDAAVDRDMKTLNSKSSKLLALKDDIRMRVIGLV